MDKEKIILAMDHIDAELIAEAAGGGKAARRYNWRKVVVIAACMCLVLAGTVLAKNGIFVEFYGRDYEWMKRLDESLVGGYWITGTEIIQENELSAEVLALAAEKPDTRFYSFQTWEEMEHFVGFDVANNALLDMAEKRELTISYLEEPVKSHGILDIQQDDLGVRAVELSAYYEYRPEGAKIDYPITVDAVIRTNLGTEDDYSFFGWCYTEEQTDSMTAEEYTMANGQTAAILSMPMWTTDGEYMGNRYAAYFNGHKSVIGVEITGLPIMLEVEGEAQYDQHALAAIKDILDAFE